jgi:hypothetical protein
MADLGLVMLVVGTAAAVVAAVFSVVAVVQNRNTRKEAGKPRWQFVKCEVFAAALSSPFEFDAKLIFRNASGAMVTSVAAEIEENTPGLWTVKADPIPASASGVLPGGDIQVHVIWRGQEKADGVLAIQASTTAGGSSVERYALHRELNSLRAAKVS